ncbi:MAG: glutamine--fructose-6-phosphate transaminase (isomerizing) [Desulfovibrionaceae bacterium]|nr:glutamine--fructose-6-phosphate transaminase (isomerizing) [Desulfovibrionaceae bacterium]
MCGIIGYIGHRPAVPIVLEGLEHLEYRGYDSAGLGYVFNQDLKIIRSSGKLNNLKEKVINEGSSLTVMTAIGHTRWATHGAPEERNAHPHMSNDKRLALVHNGIIENYLELKKDLLSLGYSFKSDTDTEVLVNLISECCHSEPDLLHALAKALRMAKGAFAICLMDREAPNVLYAARNQAPLIFGQGVGENFIASDVPAFLNYTRDVVFLEDGQILVAQSGDHKILRLNDLQSVSCETQRIQWSMQAAQKGGYRHFMLKEIFEQPNVITDGLTGRLENNDQINLPELERILIPKRLHIVACGTSYHAGLWGEHLLEHWAHIPVQTEIASEFRYKEELLLDPNEDVVLVISQSGETADTLAALRRAKEAKVKTIGLCNVVGSSIAREADCVLYTQAGPEISVASTKAMTSQMLMLTCMALYYARRNKSMSLGLRQSTLGQLRSLAQFLSQELPQMHTMAKALSRKYAQAKSFFYLGRGYCFPLALEGALKLKELSYIHAEGYAAGEMKHGPIALIDPTFPTFVLAPAESEMYAKIKSNMVEIQARQGQVIALTNPGTDLAADDRWEIPFLPGPLMAFLILPCLQLFSYEVSDYLGKDVDQPRNLAKSVTVE